MKQLVICATMCCLIWSAGAAQIDLKQTHSYVYPLGDPVLTGLNSVRCVAVAKDLEGDGKVLIAATNYYDRGHVSVFLVNPAAEALELVWTSPKVDTTPTMGGGGSTPRNVVFADLDNDGRKEVVFESKDNGVYIFEWDGVKGSHNFGTKPSQLAGPANLPEYPPSTGATAYTEHLEVNDVDGDGEQELIMSYRGPSAAEHKFMIIGAVGDWSTNDPGFSSFTMEFMKTRADLADWGLGNGTSWAMNAASLNGQPKKQVVLQAWDRKSVSILRATGANTYELANKANGKQGAMLTPDADATAYFGGIRADVDKDGCEEVYLPTGVGDATVFPLVHMISYAKDADVSEIDTNVNVSKIDFSSITTQPTWGINTGDMDGNGKPNIYVSTAELGHLILSAEFQGGNKRDPKNWVTSVLFKGDTAYYSALTIRDSLGRIDTTTRVQNIMFPSKFAADIDIDGNGREEIITGIQPWLINPADSIAITKNTWNATSKAFDVTTFKVVNPKRNTLQVLERSAATGVIEARSFRIVTPDDYVLEQNYPNPFNPSTRIAFTLPLAKRIEMKVYDVAGREVRTLVSGEEYARGAHSVTWDGTDNSGAAVSSGTYFCRLTAGSIVKTMKMMLMK